MPITEEEILARAKENCKKDGFRWDINEEKAFSVGKFQPKTGAVLDDSGRQGYRTEAQRQLLDEDGKRLTAVNLKG